MHLQEYDDNGPQISTQVPTKEYYSPSQSMRPVWYLLVIVAVVGIFYLVRRRSQERDEKEFEA